MFAWHKSHYRRYSCAKKKEQNMRWKKFGILAVVFCSTMGLSSISFASECQNWQTNHPEWIFCDDFESSGPLVESGRWFDYTNVNGNYALTSGAGVNGSKGMKVHWNKGDVNEGGLQLLFGRNPISNNGVKSNQDFRQVYFRMYLKNQSGWTGTPAKLMRATVFSASNWSQAMVAHLWPDGRTSLAVEPVSCVTGSTVNCVGYNDFTHFQWLGEHWGPTTLFDGTSAHNNVWYCIEGHVKLNDAGQSNGVEEFRVNGNPEYSATGLNFVGSYTAYAINAIFFENYWNTGATATEEQYIDNIVVSTQPIGCLNNTIPNPPINLITN